MSEFKGTINRNGRPKGAQSKVTIETRKAFNELIDGNIGQIQEDLQKLKPYERIKVLLDMARFVIPTLKAVELESQNQKENERFKPVIINFTHNETDTD
jgi:hypothetical protein